MYMADLKPIGPCTGIIYTQLFKYTQQDIAGFTENSNYYIF